MPVFFVVLLIQEGQLLVIGESMDNRLGGLSLPRDSEERLTEHTAKNIRRFYGKITGNQLPVHFTLWVPVNIFRNQAQYGSKRTCIAFGHIALKP